MYLSTYTCVEGFCSSLQIVDFFVLILCFFPTKEYGIRFSIIFLHVAANFYFIVSRIGPILPLLLDHFETIRDTIKSTLAATGKKMKNA